MITIFEQYNNLLDILNHGVSSDDPNFISNNENLPSDCKFKIGDNVKLWFEVYKLEHYYIKNNEKYCFVSHQAYLSKTWKLESELSIATPQEVEELEMKINQRKYNL